MTHKITAYAPVDAENSKLWSDECHGKPNLHQYKVYTSAQAAEENKVNATDLVKEITITWEV